MTQRHLPVRRINDMPFERFKLKTMADAMDAAMQQSRALDDDDPDPYGYGQEIEQEYGLDINEIKWKSEPGDERWEKRLRGRARKTEVTRLFLLGHSIPQIADKVNVSETTVSKDLESAGQEWRKLYIADMEVLAGRDLAAMDHLLMQLAPSIERGDVRAITTALEIIKERGSILGYRHGVQIDIEQQVREVAAANGFDPEKAVQLAQRISIQMRG